MIHLHRRKVAEIRGKHRSLEVPASLHWLSVEPSQRVQARRLRFRQLMVWEVNFTPRNFGWNLGCLKMTVVQAIINSL